MRKVVLIGATFIGAVVLAASPVSLKKWSALPLAAISNISWPLTKRKPALVIRALPLVLQESIAVIDVMNGGNIGGGTRSL